MSVDQTAAWKQVADTAFNGIDHCVAGSYSSKAKRSAAKPKMHHVRRDMDAAEHYRVMAERWAGQGDITLGGDGFMLP